MCTPGEEVKAKKENHLTRTREGAGRKEENKGRIERKSASYFLEWRTFKIHNEQLTQHT